MCTRIKQPPRQKKPTTPFTTITKRNDDIETQFPDRLDYLKNMGFDERQAQAALEKTNYDVEEATKLLKSGIPKMKKPKSEDISDDEDSEDEKDKTETIEEQNTADSHPSNSLSAGQADGCPSPKPNLESSPKETDLEEPKNENKEEGYTGLFRDLSDDFIDYGEGKKETSTYKHKCIVEGYSDSDSETTENQTKEEVQDVQEEETPNIPSDDEEIEAEKQQLLMNGIAALAEKEAERLLQLYGVPNQVIVSLRKAQKYTMVMERYKEETKKKNEQIPIEIEDDDETDSIYMKVIDDREEWLQDNPGKQLGKRFWEKLTVDERIAVYLRRFDFVARFSNRAEKWLTPEWIEERFKKGLNDEQNKRSKIRAYASLLAHCDDDSEKKADDGDITHTYYEIDPKTAPYITDDLDAIVKFAEEKLPLEAIPPQSLEKIRGFKNLSDFERIVLLQKIKDVRDGTNFAADIIQNTDIECDPDALFEKFKKGRNIIKYKAKPREIYGARSKGK